MGITMFWWTTGRVQITRNYMIVVIKNSKTLVTLQEILKIQ